MNHNIRHISIPTPCTQNWADMDIAGQGKFCQSCQKTVVDFTALTNEQILKALSSSGNTCGRFGKEQLAMLNIGLLQKSQTSRFSWKKFSLAAAFIGLIPFIKAEAKVKPAIMQGMPLFNKPVELADTTASQFKTISGIVTDSLKRPLPGAMVRIKGSQFQTVTDPNGHFSLLIPASPDLTAQVVYVGFLPQEFKVDHHINTYALVLKEMEAMMGEVMIAPVKKPQTSQGKTDKH